MKNCLKFFLLVALSFIPQLKGYSQTGSTAYSSDLSIRLLEAASAGDYAIVADCLKKGVDVNTENWDGTTALMYATAEGYKSVVRLLLEKGAKVNAKPMNGYTALITASRFGYSEITEMLLADSADVNIADNHNATALHYASLYNNDTIVFMLLTAGADPNALTRDKESPLSLAAINNSYEAAFLLTDAGANINHRDKSGFTPLMLSSQNGSLPVVELLIERGAEVNLQNNRGFSALSLAILNRHAEISDVLLDNGANANESNSISLNARTLAEITGDSVILQQLKKAGARKNLFPAFQSMGGGTELNFSKKDFFSGFFITQHDYKYNLDYNLGFAFRPSAKTISFPIPDYGEYQFMERRQLIFFDLMKGFSVDKYGSAGVSVGARLSYTFGKYRGTEIPVNGSYNAAPQAWLFFRKNELEGRLGYHFSNYGEEELGKSHFTFTLLYNFYNFNAKHINRTLKWID